MDVLNDMLVFGFHPTPTTHKAVLDASSKSRRADVILHIHNRLIGMGLELNLSTYNTLISTLCRLGMVKRATLVFKDMMGKGPQA